MDCIVHGVAKSRTQLSDFRFTFTFRMFCFDFRAGIPAPVRIQCHCWSGRRRNSAALRVMGPAVNADKACLLAALLLLCGLVANRLWTIPVCGPGVGKPCFKVNRQEVELPTIGIIGLFS